VRAGQLDEAEKHHREALRIREAKIGPDSARTAESLVNVADILLRQDRPAKAIPLARRAVPILEAAQGPEHRSVAQALAVLGAAQLGTGDPVRALRSLERSSAIAPGDEDPMLRAALSLRIAKALKAAGKDPERAHTLAQQAADNPAPAAREVAEEARAWLASNPTAP